MIHWPACSARERTIITPPFLPPLLLPPLLEVTSARAQLINPSSQTVSGAKLRRQLLRVKVPRIPSSSKRCTTLESHLLTIYKSLKVD